MAGSEPHDVARAHHRPGRGVERRPRNRLEVVAELGRQADANVVLLVVFAEPRRHQAFDHPAQLHRDRADFESKVGGNAAIDVGHHLGLAGLERAVHVHRAGHCLDLLHDLFVQALQFGHVVAAQEHAERRLGGRALHELRIRDGHLQQGNLFEPPADVFLELRESALALVFLAGLDAQRRLERTALEADRREDLPDFRHLLDHFLDAFDVGDGLLERGAATLRC